ncbi:MAG: ABC transporter permease [Gammaproteobacteria bacterium]|nr:ABC transporter permease [Gammaproteobacteria bacterium]
MSARSPTSRAPTSMFGGIDLLRATLRNRALVRQLVTRDLAGGFAGHGLGTLWVYLQPIVVVLTFMLIFGVVIGSRIAITSTFPGDYISYILVGLVPWLMTANALGRAPSVFISQSNLVKQVVFPIDALPVASTIACIVTFIPSFAILLGYKLFAGGGLSSLALLLPLVMAAHAILIIGVMLLLASITPFVRDLREIVTVYTTISMYFTPAIYLPDWVPEALRPALYVNPFSYVVWVYQDVLFFGRIAHPIAWVVMAVMTLAVFTYGYRVFTRVRPYLGNVL